MYSENGERDFTNEQLYRMLRTLPDTTQKFVVLQGCYTGGFLSRSEYSLNHIPNTTVLTAANSERPSFGCSPGDRLSHYGAAFNQALKSQPQRNPLEIPWAQVHEKLRSRLSTQEAQLGIQNALPQFSSNTPTESSRIAE